MVAPLSRMLADAARALAAADRGREACGLLLGRDGIVTAVQPCANVADDPATAFEIDPSALIAVHRAARGGGPDLLGCWHSHPNGVALPSIRDEAAAQPGQLWLIVTAAEARLFRRNAGGFVELALDGGAGPPCLADDPPP